MNLPYLVGGLMQLANSAGVSDESGIVARALHGAAQHAQQAASWQASADILERRVLDGMRVFVEVEAAAKKLPLLAMTRQAQLVLEILRRSVSGLDLRTAPPLRGTEAPDGSFLIEWTFADRRLGFNIEPKQEDSGWYFVSTKNSGGRCASGSLSVLEIDQLIRWVIQK